MTQEQFHDEMVWLCEENTRAVYHPARFCEMVNTLGGLMTAKNLLNAPTISEGFETLWEAERLDLTVEAYAIQDRWSHLFTPEEIATAMQRLEDANYKP